MIDKFRGFTIPRGTLLPAEFEYVLPLLRTKGEIVTLLVILFEYLRPGLDAQPLSFDDIQRVSGLARSTVSGALGRLLRARIIRRIPSKQSFIYEPIMSISPEIGPENDMHESCHDSCHSKSFHHDDMHASEIEKFSNLLTERCHVSSRVATDIAVKYPAEYIQRHIAYAEFADQQNRVTRSIAAYVVASIRDDWPPPKGFSENTTRDHPSWCTQEEYERFFVKPGEDPTKR